MKQTLLALSILCSCLFGNAQVLNGGFENWNITTGLPDNWWGIVMQPYDLLSQTTSAHSGNYAVKLKVDDLSGQAFASPLASGDGATTTHPLTFVPGSVSFWYELDAVSGDDLTIVGLVYQGGVGVGVAILAVPASQNYSYVNVPVTYGSLPSTADSIAIIFTLTNVSGTASIGTEAKIDDVSANVGSGIISQHGLQTNFSVNPNPANEKTTISFESNYSGVALIKIIDNNGKQVSVLNNQFYKAGKNNFEINTSTLKNGMYHCILVSNNQQAMQSFLVKH